ncbi:hypothetical protein [Aequorivita echinoideorum]|uniref:Phosphopeptide-binding protein n=1 Tax=Aequorivita echinoideorum TaxID=1549647 RepID=A0ABS5S319_9FLAO|nr:hypothetical protein [Aequorivita echinoideorum]MBT0607368.1 hypothetical protein [Aequorivita echinoideorum]
MKIKTNIAIILMGILLVGCKQKTSEANATMSPETEASENSSATQITLEKLESSPSFSEASLKLMKPSEENITNENDSVAFNFDVKNYELGAQTNSNLTQMLANSDKGQHIHFIVDNDPYSAHYESNFKKELTPGTHYLVAFLSRSYHESVKNPNAFVAKKVTIGKTASNGPKVDLNTPTIIYSRPKGEYAGKDTENLLLDFYLLNTTLSEGGNYVKATINGQYFELTEWVPYIIKGLPKGEVTVKLELVDKDGNLLPGAFNSVERKVTLKE